MRLQTAVAGHSESVVRIGGDHISILCPIGEVVAIICVGVHRTPLAIGVGPTAAHRAAIARVGRNAYGVGLLREVRLQITVACHGESIVRICRNHTPFFHPVGELKPCICIGRHHTRIAFLVDTATANRPAIARNGRNRNVIVGNRQGGKINLIAIACAKEVCGVGPHIIGRFN